MPAFTLMLMSQTVDLCFFLEQNMMCEESIWKTGPPFGTAVSVSVCGKASHLTQP